jgi:carboxypeptidase C (cathepsin A)
MSKFTVLVYLLVHGLAAAAWAADKPAPESAPAARVATHHTLVLGDRRLEYDAIAETLPVTDAKGETIASIFTVSYLAGGHRPVTFAFNGGPGAASVFLHLGALGPRVLDTPATGAVPPPPPRLVDNPSSWLAFTDLVFIDPVGTGFSRGIGKDKNPDKRFWDVDADLKSLGAVIRLWLTRHRRWDSPVYLAGESYGGFRAAVLARQLPRDDGIAVSGLVLVSPALDLSLLRRSERDLLAAAFELPSYAACVPGEGGDLAAVEHFALSDYLVGLAGMKGEPPAGDPFIKRVAATIGLPAGIIRRHRGRISPHRFAREIRRSARQIVSLYDGTVGRPARADDDAAGDPVLDPAIAAYTAAFNTYLAEVLDYHTDLTYRVLPREISQKWNWEGERAGEGGLGLAMNSLQQALLQHPGLKLLIVNGRDDLVTPYLGSRWLVDQLEVPQGVRADIHLRVYEGGHMMYMRPASRAALARDAAELYGAAAAPSR